ncbi:hypothetical protein KIW84_054371 [Lathyrus oleraceus]|uniref:DUF7745 domain-containing protein n=1 Tax=Pisum sativum TaxID=3888 RepID=A0A9D5AK05_PEA|nr:hypothetical protein KIW84_054371 [Pisum sativum]
MKLMDHDSLERFRKDYGLILRFVTVLLKDQHDALFILLQFYDPPLRCFTFPDYILVPTLEEIASFLRVPIKSQLLFYSSEFLPNFSMVASATYLRKSVLESNMIVLFPNVAKFVDVDAIRLFVLGNPVPTLLGDFFHSVRHKNENRKGGLVNCCAPLFHKLFSSHLPKSGAFVDFKDSLSWSKSCENFPNVSLVGRRGGINYNPSLADRQFGYALKTPPLEKDVEESLFFHSSSDLTVSHWLRGRVKEFSLPFPIEEPLYPPTPEQSTMVSREKYDKLKDTMEELQTKNSELSLKLQDFIHLYHEAEYQKGEAVRLQEEAKKKLVVEVNFFRKTDKALGSSGSELRRVRK